MTIHFYTDQTGLGCS